MKIFKQRDKVLSFQLSMLSLLSCVRWEALPHKGADYQVSRLLLSSRVEWGCFCSISVCAYIQNPHSLSPVDERKRWLGYSNGLKLSTEFYLVPTAINKKPLAGFIQATFCSLGLVGTEINEQSCGDALPQGPAQPLCPVRAAPWLQRAAPDTEICLPDFCLPFLYGKALKCKIPFL